MVSTHARFGAYDIVATKLLDSEELATPTVLACELRVPATNYTRLKSLVYYPGKPHPDVKRERVECGAASRCVTLRSRPVAAFRFPGSRWRPAVSSLEDCLGRAGQRRGHRSPR